MLFKTIRYGLSVCLYWLLDKIDGSLVDATVLPADVTTVMDTRSGSVKTLRAFLSRERPVLDLPEYGVLADFSVCLGRDASSSPSKRYLIELTLYSFDGRSQGLFSVGPVIK